MTQSILNFLNFVSLPHHLNHTFITLIPKVKSPELGFDFQPISLCNVLYKIILKVLAKRLNKILPNIITEHQSAFTKSRLIFDNILVAFETYSACRNIQEMMLLCHQAISKAYDRMEWP